MRGIRIIVIAAVVGWILSLPAASAGKELLGEIRVSSSLRSTDLIVYLANPPALPNPAPPISAIMDQRNQTYRPHVLAIVRGTTVKFVNSDRVAHNVFSLSPTKSFDLGKIAPSAFGLMTFEKPGVVEILCGFHSRMLAYIRVMGHPYFAVPDSQGRFVIKGVPPGTYQMRIWHGSLGEISDEVKVTAAETAPVQLRFPK